jgi:DNA polymerase-3 subunit epsilon
VIDWRLLALEFRRRRLARRLPAGPLRDLCVARMPSAASDWRAVEFAVVDLETTGTDYRSDDIVSAGWVIVRRGAIDLGTANRRMVRPSMAIPERSAIIHAITDDEAARGERLQDVLAELLAALAGRVLVAHYSPAECGFLDVACRHSFGGGLLVPVVDTLRLERARQVRAGRAPRPGELRLDALRARYELPPHTLHDALGDALATAELFLAQVAHMDDGPSIALGDLMSA